MDNVFKGLKRDIAKFKSKYITPAALEEKAPEMRKAYVDAIDAFMATPQFKKFLKAQAKRITQDAIYALINSPSMHSHLQKILAEEFRKGIEITWK